MTVRVFLRKRWRTEAAAHLERGTSGTGTWNQRTTAPRHALPKLCCFCLRLLQERNVRVGLLPEGEEVVVARARAWEVAAGGQRSGQLQPREGVNGIFHDKTAVADEARRLRGRPVPSCAPRESSTRSRSRRGLRPDNKATCRPSCRSAEWRRIAPPTPVTSQRAEGPARITAPRRGAARSRRRTARPTPHRRGHRQPARSLYPSGSTVGFRLAMSTPIAGIAPCAMNPCPVRYASTSAGTSMSGKITAAGAPLVTSGSTDSRVASRFTGAERTAKLPNGCGSPVSSRRNRGSSVRCPLRTWRGTPCQDAVQSQRLLPRPGSPVRERVSWSAFDSS